MVSSSDLVFGGAVALAVLWGVVVARLPVALARWALLPGSKRITLPLTPTAAALVLRPAEGMATYRDRGPLSFSIAALPGPERVELPHETLRFVPERNCVLAARAQSFARWISPTLVRIDIAPAEGALVLRCRQLPELALPVLGLAWLVVQRGGVLRHPGSLLVLAVAVVWGLADERRRAGLCLDAVADEMKRRLAALEPGERAETPAKPPTPPADPHQWTCACGKVNEVKRDTCRRCWASRAAPP